MIAGSSIVSNKVRGGGGRGGEGRGEGEYSMFRYLTNNFDQHKIVISK